MASPLPRPLPAAPDGAQPTDPPADAGAVPAVAPPLVGDVVEAAEQVLSADADQILSTALTPTFKWLRLTHGLNYV